MRFIYGFIYKYLVQFTANSYGTQATAEMNM